NSQAEWGHGNATDYNTADHKAVCQDVHCVDVAKLRAEVECLEIESCCKIVRGRLWGAHDRAGHVTNNFQRARGIRAVICGAKRNEAEWHQGREAKLQ